MENTLIFHVSLGDTDFYDNHDLNLLSFDVEIDTKIGQFNDYGKSGITYPNIQQGYEPQLNDKVYLAKYTSIPRVKLKNLTKEYKIKSTTDMNSATAVFVSIENMHKLTESHWYYKANASVIREFFTQAHASKHIDDYYFDKVTTALDFVTNEYVCLSYHSKNVLENKRIPYAITSGIEMNSSSFVYIKEKDTYDAVVNSTVPVYSESDLLKYINGSDALPIEGEMYESLCEMFNSSDNDNWTLAMEIMANSNFEDSLLYLGLLFYHYANKMQTNKTRNHVNFKSLLALMEIKGGYYHLDIDEITIRLKKHDKLTKENLDILLKHLGGDIIRGGDTAIFKVKTVTLSEEYLQSLNENYTLTFVDDYVPSPVEEEEVNETVVDLETEAVESIVEDDEDTEDDITEVVEAQQVEEIITKVVIDFDNVIVEPKTNNDGYFL